jgi:hypothetical protein
MNIKIRNKTRKRNKSKRNIRIIGGDELMTQEFVDQMRENMWQFMNLDTILYILEKAGCSSGVSRHPNINSEVFEEHHRDTVCFKGNINEGHYVYVCPRGTVTGTYENGLICSDDDGICHGAALAAALNNCGYEMGPIVKNPKTILQKKKNYRTIMNTYLFIINQGWWNEALTRYFHSELEWLPRSKSYKETRNAKKILTDFIKSLD